MFDSRTRMLVAALAAILFLFIQAMVPDFPLTEEQVVQAVVVLFGAFIAGEAAEGHKDPVVSVLKSAKFRALVAGVLVVGVKMAWPGFPLTEEQVADVLTVISILIFSIGARDGIVRARLG